MHKFYGLLNLNTVMRSASKSIHIRKQCLERRNSSIKEFEIKNRPKIRSNSQFQNDVLQVIQKMRQSE